jgi:hypothetical protein
VYAYQLAMANGGDANDLSSRDSADEESAYQLPNQPGTIADNNFHFFYFASLSHWPYHIQAKPKPKPRKIRKPSKQSSKTKSTKLEVCIFH